MISFLLIIFLLIASVIDIRTKVINEGLSLMSILFVLNYQVYFGNIKLAILGMTFGVLFTWIINITRLQKLGGGDAKIFSLIGACLGWLTTLATFITAWILFLPFRKKRHTIAYVPFITAAFILVTICMNVISLFRT